MNRRDILKLMAAASALPLIGLTAGCSKVTPVARRRADAKALWSLGSPDGVLKIEVGAIEGSAPYAQLYWRASRNGSAVFDWAPLGLTFAGQDQLRAVTFVAREDQSGRATYDLSHGKSAKVDQPHEETRLTFRNVRGIEMSVVLHAQNDGVALRYVVPAQEALSGVQIITGEATAFSPAGEATLWIQPYEGIGPLNPAAPSYETYHQVLKADELGKDLGWFLPVLMQAPDNAGYALISEAGLSHYAGGQLVTDPDGWGLRMRLPLSDEGLGEGVSTPELVAPFETPWRVAAIGDLDTIAATTIITDLSAPLNEMFGGVMPDWVKPGHSAWDWWNDRSTGGLAEQKAYVDSAAKWGWPYVVVDGKWDQALAPDPEAAVQELIAYATPKNVGIWLWYNSGGVNNDRQGSPRDKMRDPVVRDAELVKLAAWGVRGVKVDFWQSDKPMHIADMRALLKNAAEHKIMVNLHGCTAPRGWEREFPNLMTMEAVRGGETYTYPFPYALLTGDKGPKAIHNCRFALIRNAVGPMDYTPVMFEKALEASHITYAHSLALSVAFVSGIQHYADAAANPAHGYVPLFAARPYIQQMMSDAPVTWDETKLLSCDPNSHFIVARRSGQQWWIAGLNGAEKSQSFTLDMRFVAEGAYVLNQVRDGAAPDDTLHEVKEIEALKTLDISCLPSGGFLMQLAPVAA